MKEKAILSGKFSIYKIDNQKIIERFDLVKKNSRKINDINYLYFRMYTSVLASIRSREPIELEEFSFDDFNGIYFKTRNEPDWKPLIERMISSEKEPEKKGISDFTIENISVSYLMFYTYEGSIYAFTGGYGSTYIKNFIELYFGLYLVPKLVKKSNPVVKRILENSITGNRASIQFSNRDVTSFLTEENMGSIYKEMNIEIDSQLAKELGINFGETESVDKKITLGNKDSIVINRTLGIKELKRVVQKINKIEVRKDNFVLSYFIPVRKIGIKESDLTEELIRNHLMNKDFDSIAIVGDEYEKYYFNSSKFIVELSDGSILLESTEPITVKEVFDAVEKNLKFNLTKVRDVLKKATISTYDEANNESLFPIPLIKVIQGLIDYAGKTYYLFNGTWYIFNDKYVENLGKQFKELNKMIEPQVESLKVKFNLNLDKKMSEDPYNRLFIEDTNECLIYAHTTNMSNIEIADLIFWDEENLYLMHNKTKFDGAGVRDLTNQILTSSEFLQKMFMNDRVSFLNDYYAKLKRNSEISVSEEAFRELFDKKIHYIAGFIYNYRTNTRSTYGKYLIFDTNQKLSQRGYGLLAMNIYDE
ncbi:protein of unknown function [Acetoanaerobium sticklandii]|uniref:Uncharacterized protein n=1 Tax=Acetoanaerobium sticklandii (strain ATCC 12662 / DSM 519 / JCM 1433 / CCUG 9281 / NCIMB 10654 / HF) TaxID=499177 RepID=E3PVS8_ACESD|nr:DUF6119 family protein [Acetoanaerobium sticklandii]CBH22631.1 protein of unknown function [Acetoanaerobium sticklandii]